VRFEISDFLTLAAPAPDRKLLSGGQAEDDEVVADQ
jgi:hypothetical protein